MIGQNLYYLNSSKYVSNTSNLGTVVGELNSYYHTKTPRNIVIVHHQNGATHMPGAHEAIANEIRTGAGDLISYKTWDEVDNIDYIQNSDKVIILFATVEDMITVLARYTAGLIQASGFYPADSDYQAMTSAFISKILDVDLMFTYINNHDIVADIPGHLVSFWAGDTRPAGRNTPYTVIFQNGKNFSYDLLFFLNDYYRCSGIQGLIKEKFTVHQSTMAQDVMEHFTSRRHYMAYILSVIDWMNANVSRNAQYATDKKPWIVDAYITKANTGNYTAAFYKLEELWNLVKDDTAFIAAHQDKADSDATGWEYMDLYTEFKNVFPIVRKVLQNDFDMNNLTMELRLINTDVQFFSKRQNRIPYLIHKYPL